MAHGINEYGGRYAHFASWLVERGIALAVHDHMGHGETAGLRENLGLFAEKRGWLNALADIRNFSALLREKHPNTPFFLLGHSLGSFMARDICIRYDDSFDGVILSGTTHNSWLMYATGKLACGFAALRHGKHGKSRMVRNICFGGYVKKYAAEGNSAAWICSDPAVYGAYVADPYCRFVPGISMFSEVFGGMRHMDNPANFCHIRKDQPFLLFSGDCDAVGNMGKGVSRVYRLLLNAGVEDVELLMYAGGRHEMLNEVNREEVYLDVYEWISRHLPAAIN